MLPSRLMHVLCLSYREKKYTLCFGKQDGEKQVRLLLTFSLHYHTNNLKHTQIVYGMRDYRPQLC